MANARGNLKVKFVMPAPMGSGVPFSRRLKYSLFPPLGLATLAAYLRDEDDATLQDEHVEPLELEDSPDIVAIEVYIASAARAYEVADHYRRRGVHVALGGLHVTSLPHEAAQHADSLFLGPGEETWPTFLQDFRQGRARALYQSSNRTLHGIPPIRRDLIKRPLYLVPNSIVVSRGCPHLCDFCYKETFYRGGRSFYTQTVDDALAEIDRLPGCHLYFLDDHLFGQPAFARELFEGMCGMGRLWQAASTVQAVLKPGLIEAAAASGLRSLFVGFETLSAANLRDQRKAHNLHADYAAAVRRLHDCGVMVNASFVFGMDDDDASVFDRTVVWAVGQGIETATFHILTPYPGTPLHARMEREGRMLHANWSLYDTTHAVFTPARMTCQELENGFHRAKREFYGLRNILSSASHHEAWADRVRHAVYAGGMKRCEPVWNLLIQTGRIDRARPLLESVLQSFGARREADRTNRYASEPEVREVEMLQDDPAPAKQGWRGHSRSRASPADIPPRANGCPRG